MPQLHPSTPGGDTYLCLFLCLFLRCFIDALCTLPPCTPGMGPRPTSPLPVLLCPLCTPPLLRWAVFVSFWLFSSFASVGVAGGLDWTISPTRKRSECIGEVLHQICIFCVENKFTQYAGLYAGPNYSQSHVLVDTWMLSG